MNVPCSSAGHYERKGYRDYRQSWNHMIFRNFKRLVEVWFDEFKDIVYQYQPQIKVCSNNSNNAGNIQKCIKYKTGSTLKKVFILRKNSSK